MVEIPRLLSPCIVYPQSNGEAERAVQTAKNFIKKADNLDMALLCYRTTPIHNGRSPAELLMGRKLRSNLPILPSDLNPNWKGFQELREKEEQYKAKMKMNFDKHHGVRPLSNLDIGKQVYIPDMMIEGEVQGACAPRSLLIETPKGVTRRNRRDVRELPEESEKPKFIPEAPSEVPTFKPEPQETVSIPLRRSQRTSKPPARFADYDVCAK